MKCLISGYISCVNLLLLFIDLVVDLYAVGLLFIDLVVDLMLLEQQFNTRNIYAELVMWGVLSYLVRNE